MIVAKIGCRVVLILINFPSMVCMFKTNGDDCYLGPFVVLLSPPEQFFAILLCLSPDDFTCQRGKDPFGKWISLRNDILVRAVGLI